MADALLPAWPALVRQVVKKSPSVTFPSVSLPTGAMNSFPVVSSVCTCETAAPPVPTPMLAGRLTCWLLA